MAGVMVVMRFTQMTRCHVIGCTPGKYDSWEYCIL